MYFFYVWTTDSTQNHSKSLCKLHFINLPFWVQSQYQTSGRGQRGRKWSSFIGNLFLTGCFFLPKKNITGQLSIFVGVSLAKILQLFLPNQQIGLKWPNDLLCDHKKVGGILIEIEENTVYIGIGINISAHPEGTQMPATHLQTYGFVNINILIEKITETLLDFQSLENFEEIQQAWWLFAKDNIAHWKVREPIDGIIIGIDEHGQLLVQAENGSLTKRHQTFEE